MKKQLLFLVITLLISSLSFGQFSVTTNGGSGLASTYSSLAAAITALNGATITAPVVITCPTGSETAPIAGYVITATGTAANTIIIQGNGAANSIITAYTPQASGVKTDAIIKIVGGDYITIQGFTLRENPSNTTTAVGTNNMTEIGIGLWLASATNGAQNNTIQNNTITLGSTYQNAIGILTSSSSSSTNGVLAATATTGTNSNNKFYSNIISNVAYGMYLICEPITATITEGGNDIGGSSLGTGNTITFGNATTSDIGLTRFSGTQPAGIYFRNGVGDNVRFNSVTSNSLAYVQSQGVFGVYFVGNGGTAPTGVTYTSTISDNTINLTNTGTTSITGIDFGAGISTGTIVGSNNSVTLNQTSGAANSAAAIGIKANYASATNTCNSNTVVLNITSSAGALSGAATGMTLAGASTTNTANSNNITINQTGSGTGTITSTTTALSVAGAATTINALTNTILINQTTSVATGITTGTISGILANAVATTVNVTTTNAITVKQAVTGSGTYGTNAVTYINVSAASGTINVKNNNLNTTGSTIRSTGAVIGVFQDATVTVLVDIQNNTMNVDRVATSGSIIFQSTSGTPSEVKDIVSNNSITFTNLAGTTSSTAISSLGGPSSPALNNKSLNTNTINISGTNSGTTIGITSGFTNTGFIQDNSITISCAAPTVTGITTSGTAMTLSGNTLNLASSSTSPTAMQGINETGTGAHSITNNTFSAMNFTGIITSSPIVSGIAVSSNAGANLFGNTITNISVGAASSTGSPIIDGILISGGTSINVFKNKIYGITTAATGATTIMSGIRLSGGTTNTVYNNLIGNLNAGAATNSDAIRGINITSTSTSTNNIYYNTVHLSGSGGINFGTSGIYHAASSTATTAKLELRNNIIVNNCTPSGTGLVVVYRRSNGTANMLNNYANTSNNNLFYTTPSTAGYYFYHDGTSSAQTMVAYKSGVFTAGTIAPRDAVSISENPTFTSTTGSNTDYLHISTSVGTGIESGGANIAGITDDYDGHIRFGNAGYPGGTPGYPSGGSAPDIGADEFAGMSVTPTIVLSTNDIVAGNIAAGSTNNAIYSFAIAVTVANANLTGLNITTTGSYVLADVTNLKAWYQTAASLFNPGTATLLSTYTNTGGAGSIVFPSFVTQSISAGSTGYIFITSDISCAATIGNTIAVNAVTSTNTTFAAGSPTGTPAAGNTQTISAIVLNDVTGAAASSLAGSSAVSWTNPAGCYNEVMIVAAAASYTGTPTGDGTAYSANLAYGSGTALGNGYVVYKGSTSPQTVTGLTNGTPYYFKIFTRLGTSWSSGVEVSATPAIVYCASTTRSTAPSAYITNFTTTGGTTNVNNNSTYTLSGSGDFTAQTVTQVKSGTVNYSATISGVSGGVCFGIFVDWNQNGVFTDAGETVVSLGSPTQITTNPSGSFSVPAGALIGNTRMRVVVNYAIGAVVSCNTLINGDTEDYSFNVTTPVVPSITLSDNVISTGNIAQGSTNNPLYSFAISPTVASATLTGLTVTTNGTYLSADVTNLKCYYQSSSTFNAGTATVLSTLTTPGTAGLKTFPSFVSQTIAKDATGYIFITANLPCTATLGNTIALDAVTGGNTTFLSGTATGTLSAGNTQTIIAATPVNVTGAAASTLTSSSAVSWINPIGCYDEVMIVAAAASNSGTPSGDGSAYTANLAYGSGTALGNGYVVYKGSTSPQTVTGLTNGTPYYFKIFTRLGTSWSSGVEVSATPVIIYCTAVPISVDGNGITNVTIGTLNNTNVSTLTYQNFTGLTPTTLTAGSTAPISITLQTGYTYNVRVFIDLNQDGDFADANENNLIGLSSSANPTTITGNVFIPITATLGNTRMRVVGTDNDTGNDPCWNNSFANVEDYTITIVAPSLPTITSLVNTSGCVGSSLIINGTNLSGATSVTIGGTTATITANTAASVTVTVGNGTTGTVSVTTGGGTATSTETFTVNQLPADYTVSGGGAYCAGGTGVSITLSGSESGVDYALSTSPVTTQSGNGGALTFGPTAFPAGTYTITATNTTTSCSSVMTGSASVTVNPVPPAPTAGSNSPICQGSTLNLTASTVTLAGYSMNGNSGVSFIDISSTGTSVGTLSDDSEHNLTIPNFNFNGTPYTTARVGNNGVLAFGATSGDLNYTNIALPAPLGANGIGLMTNVAGSTLTAICANWDDMTPSGTVTTSIVTQTIGNIYIVQWTNEDNFNATGTGTITFQIQLDLSNGKIHLVYTDITYGAASYDGGLSATIGLNYSATSALQYSFNTSSLVDGQSITFTPNTVAYSWTGPNSFTSLEQNPSITNATPVTAGIYTVTVTNTITGCSSSATTTVTVNSLPDAPTAGNVTATYNGSPHTGTATPPSGSTIIWYNASTGGSVTSAPLGTDVGTYSAWAESVDDVTLCTSAARTEVTVTINNAPLTIAGTFTAVNKVYDGSTDATIIVNSLALVTPVTGDDVSLTGIELDFANGSVGTGKTVSITSASLSGADAGNYTLSLAGAPTTMADITPVTVSLKVMLQGPYDSGPGTMKTDLYTAGKIPTTQPYGVAPWNYSGGETATPSSTSVDWVLVDLRSDESTKVARFAGLLNNDGTIGITISDVAFPGIHAGLNYYIVVWHRNHMPVMSAGAQTMPVSSYDFTQLSNIYGTNPAIDLGGSVYGMIAGDVTKNGRLQYSGAGNDRGPIIAKIISEPGGTGVGLYKTVTDDYWFENTNMDNILRYLGEANDRGIILANLNTLVSPSLNSIYTSVVPGAAGGKDAGKSDGPFDIQLSEFAPSITINLITNETVENGLVDNIQFTLAWKEDDLEIAELLSSFTSDFMLAPQGEAYVVNGVMHQVYVSVTPVGLPEEFNEGDQVTVLSFDNSTGQTVTGRLWIADDDFTADNNAMYYVSVWGNDFTGLIQSITTGLNEIPAAGSVSIYPNPVVNGMVNIAINLEGSQDVTITLMDMQGKTISGEEINVNAGLSIHTYDLKGVGKGVYFIRISCDNLNIIEKLVIQSIKL